MFILKKKSTWLKLLEVERKAREDVLFIQGTMNREMERLEKKITELEGKIIAAQEQAQQFFYKKEKELQSLLSLDIIDHKEFHYSQKLLLEIEKSLDHVYRL